MTDMEFKERHRIVLNPQQEAAVRAVDGAVLLLAVPGSGKTTVLVTRLAYLIYYCGVDPKQILTMTYTKAATGDMRSRFAALFGMEAAEQMEFRTMNGVSHKIIQYYEKTRGRTAFALIESEKELAAILSELYRKNRADYMTESVRKTIQSGISYIKNMMLSSEEIEVYKLDGISLAPIYYDYCAVLKEYGWMDYDDQMVYAYRILKQCPDILDYFRKKYPYVCVDEAQDTSKIQHEIIRLLVGERGNLFMVGDEDQSIYGFRAAYPAALMEFTQIYPDARVLLLEQNYRSTEEIVDTADRFIQKNQSRHPKHMSSVRGRGRAIVEIPVFDRAAQYRYLLEVAKACATETAVLYRNNESALPMIDLLSRAGLPYRCRQFDSSFFTHRTVQDITDIIHFASNPQNGALFLNIYYKLNAGISKAAAELAIKQSAATGKPIFELLAEVPGLSAYAQSRCEPLQRHLEQLLRESGGDAVRRIVNYMGYGRYLAEREADLGKVQILAVLGDSEPSAERLLARLRELAEIVQNGSANMDCNFVLSTIHSSKGLEYDRVFLADVVDGILPGMRTKEKAKMTQGELEALEEERRLFYVGMTRAKNELAIFRFQKPGFTAAFTDEVFKKEAKKLPVFRNDSSIVPTQRAEWRSDEFVTGTPVVHKRFGAGMITESDGSIIAICFTDGSLRRFLLSAVLKQGMLMRKNIKTQKE